MKYWNRQRTTAVTLAAVLLAAVLLWCQGIGSGRPAQAAAAGPRSVAVCGTPFGVKMFSDGALVVAFADRYSASGRENPAKEAGLRLGDLIISAAGQPVHSNDELSAALQTGQGSAVTIVYRRGGHECTAQLTPWADASGVYKAGLWVRDSSAGIGTLTFVDPVAGTFAGLGHPISDVDTGADFTLLSGEIVPVTITGVAKASPGTPGELRGEFLAETLGIVTGNDTTGLYGKYTDATSNLGTLLPVAQPSEVQPGAAEVWTTLTGRTAKHYTVQIERVDTTSRDPNRNLTLRVTDPELLTVTGGIVQGMSGSPLVQNGKLIGAVTHVLVGTPAKGYGIFADTMVKMAESYNKAG